MIALNGDFIKKAAALSQLSYSQAPVEALAA